MGLFSAIDTDNLEKNIKRQYNTKGEYIVYYTVLFIARGIRKYSRYLGRSSIWFIVIRKVIVFIKRHPRVKEVLFQAFNQMAKKHSIDNKNPDALTQNIFDCLEDTIY